MNTADTDFDDGAGDMGARHHEIVLRLLDSIDRDPTVTQRRLADDFGIALGLVNAYLKRCTKKGLVKIREVPARRYAYYLTPQGFREKARLTSTYLQHSFTFFRNARLECREVLDECAASRWMRVALAGRGDLAEIIVLCAMEGPVSLVGVVDPRAPEGALLLGLPVVADLGRLPAVDAVVVTDLERPQAAYDEMVDALAPDRVLAPKLLRVVPAGRSACAGADERS